MRSCNCWLETVFLFRDRSTLIQLFCGIAGKLPEKCQWNAIPIIEFWSIYIQVAQLQYNAKINITISDYINKSFKLSVLEMNSFDTSAHTYMNIYIGLTLPGGGWVVQWCWVTSSTGASYNLGYSRARAYCTCSRCGWELFGHFYSHLSFLSSLSLSLGDGPI